MNRFNLNCNEISLKILGSRDDLRNLDLVYETGSGEEIQAAHISLMDHQAELNQKIDQFDVNSRDKLADQLHLDYIDAFSEDGLAWGYQNIATDNILRFPLEFFVVKEDGTISEPITGPVDDWAPFHHGFAWYRSHSSALSSRWHMIDSTGHEVDIFKLNPLINSDFVPSDLAISEDKSGRIIYTLTGHVGTVSGSKDAYILDYQGRVIFNQNGYTWASPFSEGHAVVMKEDRNRYFLYPDGREINVGNAPQSPTNDGVYWVDVGGTPRDKLLEYKTGKVKFSGNLEIKGSFSEGCAIIKHINNSSYDIINREGREIIRDLRKAEDFSEGVAYVEKINFKTRETEGFFIDNTGTMVGPVFKKFNDLKTNPVFSEGVCQVRKGDEYIFIDHNFKQVFGRGFKRVMSGFKNGVAIVTELSGETRYINIFGRHVLGLTVDKSSYHIYGENENLSGDFHEELPDK